MIATPYLLFLGDAVDGLAAKVAQGIRDWRPEYALGQLRMPGCNADMHLPDMTLAQAKAAGCKTIAIGVANRGGVISPAWKAVLIAALEAEFDLASGLHNLLRDEADLVAVAKAHGRTLHDVRVPDVDYPIANGRKRSGKRMLAVGTDCSVGKMYTALCMEKEMRARSMKATVRDTALTLARVVNPACVATGVAINTQHWEERAARAHLAKVEDRMGLPATDPFRFGAGVLVDALAKR